MAELERRIFPLLKEGDSKRDSARVLHKMESLETSDIQVEIERLYEKHHLSKENGV